MSEELVKKIDKLAKQNYTSRSDIIRQAIIEKLRKPGAHPIPTLEGLLKGVTPELVGGEFDWGPDVGKEIID